MNTITHQYADIMLKHMPVGVALYDARSFLLLSANALFHTFIDTFLAPEWQGERAIGHTLQEVMPATAIEPLLTIFRTVAETGIAHRSDEYAIDFPGHSPTYWDWTLAAVRDEQGKIIQLVQTAIEITAHVLARQYAEQLQTSLQQTNLGAEAERQRLDVIETVASSVRESLETKSIGKIAIEAIKAAFNPNMVAIHTADASQQALRLLHMSVARNEQVANAFLYYIPYSTSLLIAAAHRSRTPIVIENMQAAAEAGQISTHHPAVLNGARGFVCVPLWFKDYFEGALSATFDYVISPDGPEVQTLMGCGTHIAAAIAHARLHETVRNERVRLRSVLDQLPEGILITEAADGSISYANEAAARILGFPYRQLVGSPLHRYSHEYSVTGPNGRPALPWHFTIIRSLSGEIVSGQETLVTQPNGSKVITLSSCAPLCSENDVITGAVIVFQDITTQKSIEQQKNEFLSIASHELRTPITAIQGFAEILQLQTGRQEELDKSSLRAINVITEQSQHLTQLIDDMLDISRIEQTQLQLKLAPHTLSNLITTLSHVIESHTVSMRQHQFHLHLEDIQEQQIDSLHCTYDEERITQVLSNLLNNAMKYSPANSKIEIGLCITDRSAEVQGVQGAQETAREVEIWVSDQGIGIASNELPMIFKRFYRARNLDSSFSGFGIGLYLVKEIINHHSGRVWAESIEGSGSTFHIALPLTELF